MAARVLLASVVSVGVFGCGSENANSSATDGEQLSAVLYKEIQNPDVCPRANFAAGETPAIKISGCGAKEVRYIIVETAKGNFVAGQTVLLKNGQIYYRPLPHIPPGQYKVSMAGDGVTSSSYSFTVTN